MLAVQLPEVALRVRWNGRDIVLLPRLPAGSPSQTTWIWKNRLPCAMPTSSFSWIVTRFLTLSKPLVLRLRTPSVAPSPVCGSPTSK